MTKDEFEQQLADEHAAAEKRNQAVNEQVNNLETAKKELSNLATNKSLPAEFYSVIVRETPLNPKIDLLDELVDGGNKLLKDSNLSEFEVHLTSDAQKWAQDESRSIDEFKPEESTPEEPN